MVPVEEESVLALDLAVLELVLRFAQQKPSPKRNAKHPEQETRNASKQSPVEVRSSEALDVEILDQTKLRVDSATTKE